MLFSCRFAPKTFRCRKVFALICKMFKIYEIFWRGGNAPPPPPPTKIKYSDWVSFTRARCTIVTNEEDHIPSCCLSKLVSCWLHTRACKYNLSALETYFECEGVKPTNLNFT